MSQIHDHVRLEVERDSGNCDHREAVGSREEVRDRTGELCEIKGVRLQRQCSGLRYMYLHSVTPRYLRQHPVLKHHQPVLSKYESNIIFRYILNFIFFKASGKTEWSRDWGNFSLVFMFHEFIF